MNKFIFEIDQQKNSKKRKCIMGKQPSVIGQNTKDRIGSMKIEFYAWLLWRFVINFMWLEWQNESYLINTKRTILKLNKRVLTTGPVTPGYLYWNCPVITSVRSVKKAYHTSDFSLTSYHLESKNLATLKYKKGHNSGKDCQKIVIIELDLDTPTYNT